MELDGSDLRIRAMVFYERAVQAMRRGQTAAATDRFCSFIPKAKHISSLGAMCFASAAFHQASRLSYDAIKSVDIAAAETMLAGLKPGTEPTWILQFALAVLEAQENNAAAAMPSTTKPTLPNAPPFTAKQIQWISFDDLIHSFDVGGNDP